jgi:type I restriction enzyme, S subunit
MSSTQVPEGYKQTEVGVIPEDWGIEELCHLCESIVDCSHSTPVWTSSGVVVIRNQNIRDGNLDLSEPSYTDEFHFLSRTRRAIPKAGDLVITREAPMGEVCMIPIGLRCCLGQRMVLLRPHTEKCDSQYLVYELQSEIIQRYIRVNGGTGSTVGNLRIPLIESMPVPFPPLPEQRSIAQALSDVDALIAALDKLIAKKCHLKTATMQQLLTGKMRLPGFGEGKGYKKTEIGNIPEDWELKQIDEIADVDPENLTAKTNAEYKFKYISLEDVDQGTLRGHSEQVFFMSPSRARRIVRYDDVLLSTVRPNLKSHLIFKQHDKDWVCSTGFAVLRCKADLSISEFLFAHLFGDNIEKQIETLIAGSNYPAISSGDVRKLKIPVPNVKEQKSIAQVLSNMDTEITALETRRAKTQAIKQGMMQELLTGRTRLI